jgi:hypothetical protein
MQEKRDTDTNRSSMIDSLLTEYNLPCSLQRRMIHYFPTPLGRVPAEVIWSLKKVHNDERKNSYD